MPAVITGVVGVLLAVGAGCVWRWWPARRDLVSGFGWLLIALGVAQTDPESLRTRASYVLVFALVYLYREIPWALIGVG